MLEMDKIKDKMNMYKDKSLIENQNRYILLANGKKHRLGDLQLRILNDLLFTGYKIYDSPSKELGSGYRAALRKLKKYGYMIRLYVNRYEHFSAIFYTHKARDLVLAIYDKYPHLTKKPTHMKCIDVPIMRNLNKLGTISKLKHMHYQGKLNDPERNSYGLEKLAIRRNNKRKQDKSPDNIKPEQT